MLFTHDTNADQFHLFAYGNLRGVEANSQRSSLTELDLRDTTSNSHVTDLGKENIYSKSEESSLGNSFKDGFSISPENFSFSWLSGDNCQSAALDHDKRPLSSTNPCQVSCKRPKQTDQSTWLYSFEEHPFSNSLGVSSSALSARQLNHIPANKSTTICSVSSGIPSPNRKQLAQLESLHLPDLVTSFPGYFEDCGLVAGDSPVNAIDSPVHEYVPGKDVPIGPDHQADIPEWRPRVCVSASGAFGSCADMAYSSVSTSEPRDDDSESDKWWVSNCVIPMSSCSSPVDCTADNKIDCDCSDDSLGRCARQHIIEARESLKMSLGQGKFCDLRLCEMGEDVAQRWTDEEEKRFQGLVFSNPVSLGKNFWDYLPHAFPGRTSKELVSYYFNVFIFRKRAQQNRSDMLYVDSDDDELHDDPSVTEEKEDSAVVIIVVSSLSLHLLISGL